MASYTTIADWQDVEAGYVVSVTIRQTEDEKYPCGWDYSLHPGKSMATPFSTTIMPTSGRRDTSAIPGMTLKTSSFGDAHALRPLQTRSRGADICLVGLARHSVGHHLEVPTLPVLEVTVGNCDRLDQQTRSRIKAAQEGEDLDDVQPVLNFESYADLSRLLSPKNPELLETIAESDPESIRETAKRVDRDYKQVHRNLSELADIGVIEFDGGGSGQAKKPTLAYDGLEIDIPFADSSATVDPAAP